MLQWNCYNLIIHTRTDLIENEMVGKWMLLINAGAQTSSPKAFMTECCADGADGQRCR